MNQAAAMGNLHHYKKTYRASLRRKIGSLPGQVFNRGDLTQDHSNKEQLRLNRALKAFVDEGFIIKISHGLYAKAEKMTFANGEKTVLRESFESVAIEALDKLGIKWEFGSAIQEYNRGETTQVPATFIIQLKSRFRGHISAEGKSVIFENDIYAR